MPALNETNTEMAEILAELGEKQEECVISPSGDTILHVGEPCEHLVVSSKVLETSSPIFAIMVAKARMRLSRGEKILYLRFQFDSLDIIGMLMLVLHGAGPFKDVKWAIDTVWELIRVAQNYRCAPHLLEFIEGLYPVFEPLLSIISPDAENVNRVDRFEDQLKLVAIAMTVDSELVFWNVTKTMIKEYTPDIEEEVGLDWSIVHPKIYRFVYEAIQDLSQEFKRELHEGITEAAGLVTSISEQFHDESSRCPISYISCFEYTLHGAAQTPSSAPLYEVRNVVKKYRWCLAGVCKSGCTSCDALGLVRSHLRDVLISTSVSGLCLSDWMEWLPSTNVSAWSHCHDEDELSALRQLQQEADTNDDNDDVFVRISDSSSIV
ncbi:hypothetical protein Plec18167_001691 [Paecilomyces lecythidis]|uniref:BTB domain-containing protein n=1 Tax=Paecilomyces lecythidis TaxID=3004212 RepID=A0ABR3YC46_9EURO